MTDYVGRRPCGCVSYLSSGECDDPEHVRATRREVVRLVEAGATVARMPRAAWEKLPWECPVCQGGPGRRSRPGDGGAVVSDSDRGPATADGRAWKGEG